MDSKKFSNMKVKVYKNNGMEETFVDTSMLSPFLPARTTKLSGAKEKSNKKSHTSANDELESGQCSFENKNSHASADDDVIEESEQCSYENKNSHTSADDDVIDETEQCSYDEKNSNCAISKNYESPSDNEESDNEVNSDASLPLADTQILSKELPKYKKADKCVFEVNDQLEEVPKFTAVPCAKIIGVIGCGPMAQEIINILLENNFKIKVWNRTPKKYEHLPSSVKICRSPAHLVKKTDFVVCCVADEDAVSEIVFGAKGILHGLSYSDYSKGKKGYIEMSSIKSSVIASISEEVTGRGGLFLDGQIQGTRLAARMASLVIVASGDRSLFEAARPFFAAIAHRVFYLNSEAGTASETSTIVTAIQAMVISSLGDIMTATNAINEQATENFTQLLNSTVEMPVCHAIAQTMAKQMDQTENIVDTEEPAMLTLGHLHKNLKNALELGYKYSTPTIYASTASEVYKASIKKFSKSHDVSVLSRKRKRSPHET